MLPSGSPWPALPWASPPASPRTYGWLRDPGVERQQLDTTGLGITTILLSLVAGVGLMQGRGELQRWERIAVLLLVIACAAVCFTTVSRLWWSPAPC